MRPETIENEWGILYKEYPEVYDEFASVTLKPDWVAHLSKILKIKWNDKTVADIGSGSGLSSFELADHVKFVIGIEPDDKMRAIAVKNAKKRKTKNVKFVKGWAAKVPLQDDSVDAVTSFTAPLDYKESMRITKLGGYIIKIDVAMKWYGGELAPIILGKSRTTGEEEAYEEFEKSWTKLNFKHKDFYQIQEYGSLDKIIRTYGFIFGKKAIEYLKNNNKTSIKWKWRIHYKKV